LSICNNKKEHKKRIYGAAYILFFMLCIFHTKGGWEKVSWSNKRGFV